MLDKRVAVVVYSYFPSDPRVYRETRALVEAGAEVDLFCLRKEPDEPPREFLNRLSITRVDVKKSRAGKLAYIKQYVAFSAAAFLWLSRRSLKHRYDLVHVHNMPDFLVFSAVIAKLLGAKIVLDLHDPMPEVMMAKYDLAPNHWLLRVLRLVEKLSIGFANLVLTPNVAFRELFIFRCGAEWKIEIVMNAPLENLFPLRLPKTISARDRTTPFVIMYHGTLVERHGLHIALQAIKKLVPDFPGISFHIYGAETPYLNETIFHLIEQLSLGDRVHYHGEQPQDVIADAIARSDLGLIPNLESAFTRINFPTRIFEYLALGKPVIVPRSPGITDYFSTENMLFFHWGDGREQDALSTQIRWVFEHPKETRVLVEKGQEVYRRHAWARQRTIFIDRCSDLFWLG
jgi:glycosyltransferase involved in cell wall biosynthesis